MQQKLTGSNKNSKMANNPSESYVSGPEVIKHFLMFNSAEHEMCPANISQITNNGKFFLAKNS